MFVALAFGYGLIVGSFLNALVFRLREGKSVAKGRSRCPKCGHQLGWRDLLPVLSWLWLKGKCRYCGKSISMQYPAVELVTAALFAWSYSTLMPFSIAEWVSFFLWLFILSCLIALTVYDLRWMLLPDRLVYPAMAAAALSLVLAPERLMQGVLAGLAAGAIFYVLASVADGKLMGGGDVKLVTMMGLLLGSGKMVLALVLGFNLAAVAGIYLILSRRRKRGEAMPFGPFLAAGAVISYLHGEAIIQTYLKLGGL